MFPRQTHDSTRGRNCNTGFWDFSHTWVVSENDAFFFLSRSRVQNPCKNSEIHHSRTATSPWFSAKSLRHQRYHHLCGSASDVNIRVGRGDNQTGLLTHSAPYNKHFSPLSRWPCRFRVNRSKKKIYTYIAIVSSPHDFGTRHYSSAHDGDHCSNKDRPLCNSIVVSHRVVS